MPELPEVEVLKNSLSKFIIGYKIKEVEIKNRNLRFKVPLLLKKKLKNNTIKRITRRSKYIILEFQNSIRVLVHLGMSGVIFIKRKSDQKSFKTSFYYNLNKLSKHNHILIHFDNGLSLVYNDPRRFGFFKLFDSDKFLKINSSILNLGPEPLENFFNYKYFKTYIANRNLNIKTLLMNQNFVAGLGNIYVNEIIFLSKINPLLICKYLSKKNIHQLLYYTKNILKKAILRGGSSIKDFYGLSGKKGRFQDNFKVYGREKLKCTRRGCVGIIKKLFISKRSTFYCPKCQK